MCGVSCGLSDSLVTTLLGNARMSECELIKQVEWELTIPIRHAVLWPHKKPEFCHVKNDPEGWHFACYVDEAITSVASVYRCEGGARLRKFATLPEYQGRGMGSRVLQHILCVVKDKGVTYFYCDARESAIDFYERFGLCTEGERFYKSDVPYFRMSMNNF